MAPFPAKVLMMPLGDTIRMRLFKESAIYTFPAASTAIPTGRFNCAFTAGPLSPENPGRELPATSVKLPLELILKTQLPLVKYRLPDESTASRRGCPIEIAVALTGVAGGTPPATVVMEYCCPWATQAQSS